MEGIRKSDDFNFIEGEAALLEKSSQFLFTRVIKPGEYHAHRERALFGSRTNCAQNVGASLINQTSQIRKHAGAVGVIGARNLYRYPIERRPGDTYQVECFGKLVYIDRAIANSRV